MMLGCSSLFSVSTSVGRIVGSALEREAAQRETNQRTLHERVLLAVLHVAQLHLIPRNFDAVLFIKRLVAATRRQTPSVRAPVAASAAPRAPRAPAREGKPLSASSHQKHRGGQRRAAPRRARRARPRAPPGAYTVLKEPVPSTSAYCCAPGAREGRVSPRARRRATASPHARASAAAHPAEASVEAHLHILRRLIGLLVWLLAASRGLRASGRLRGAGAVGHGVAARAGGGGAAKQGARLQQAAGARGGVGRARNKHGAAARCRSPDCHVRRADPRPHHAARRGAAAGSAQARWRERASV